MIGITDDAIRKTMRDGRLKSTKRYGVYLIRQKDAEKFKTEYDAWKAAAKKRRLARPSVKGRPTLAIARP